MRDNQPILEQVCGNAGLTRKCVQIPHNAGHLTGLSGVGDWASIYVVSTLLLKSADVKNVALSPCNKLLVVSTLPIVRIQIYKT